MSEQGVQIENGQLGNGWSIKAIDQLQRQRNEAMSLMAQGLDLMSQAIKRAPSLSFEAVLTNNFWYSNGRFEQLKHALDHALDQRCLEVLAEIHPNEQEMSAQKSKRRMVDLADVKELPLQLDLQRRELVLALRYFEGRGVGSGSFAIGRYLRAQNCFDGNRWAEYSAAADHLHQLWNALMVFDRLVWSNGKPSRGAARFMEPSHLIAEGLKRKQLVYDFLVFKVRVVGSDMLIDFTDRQDLLKRVNLELDSYFGRK